MMDPKSFLELTESQLLTKIDEELRAFFADKHVTYVPSKEHEGLFERIEVPNPRSAILPLAQINTVVNVTFHLMAQQLVSFFHQKPDVSRQKVFDTTIDNIRKLVVKYTMLIKEAQDAESNGSGSEAGRSVSVGV